MRDLSSYVSNGVTWAALVLGACCGLSFVGTAAAQAPLYLVNDSTSVSSVSFLFPGTQTFTSDTLQTKIVTKGPTFWDKVKRILPLLEPAPYPFSPVELARDVHRLRQFYRQNGFYHADIDYRASQLDTTANQIHVIFSILEGEPVIIQDVGFFDVEGRSFYYQLPPDEREGWVDVREQISVHTGDRYTFFDRFRIESAALAWLRNRGYAFATANTNVRVDSLENTADLHFILMQGPKTHIDEITVEGVESVGEDVVLRQLPFQVGDVFDSRKLLQGQRDLYSLNLFRVAVIDVPDQPRDSTVTVRVQVREAEPRYVSARGGYGIDAGVNARADWTHRNFLGGARTFTVSAIAQTGIGSTPATTQILPSRVYRAGVSLTQPYLFSRRLSGTIAPYVQLENDPRQRAIGQVATLQAGDPLQINSREFGNNTTLIYQFYPYRSLQFRHTFIRSLLRNQASTRSPVDSLVASGKVRDLYSQSILALSGVIGHADNYITPTRGFLVRPFAETGGTFLASDIDYVKIGTEATGYLPIGGPYRLAGRFFAGRVWPFGFSNQALLGHSTRSDSLIFENRFDDIVFYAGGPTLRGWNGQLAGRKDPRPVLVFRSQGDTTVADTSRYFYEPRGALAQLGGNVELRMPFPGLGPSWRAAAFVDAAMLGDRGFDLGDVFADVGVGVRYLTLIGAIRLDLAYKLNPTYEDLRDPESVYKYRHGLTDEVPDVHSLWRFNIQLSIGPAF
ncbi:MAG TPA: BamA/TamA family outer membrane protein [Rhodothermales bacterium]|nr:BamA/TamA family outer membrane protein [Rhodothermales bacterium]